MMKKKRSNSAISPVIATVIIVAVAIAVAIAVAYWVTGIIPAFTRYEELKISSCYIEDATAKIYVKNTGSADATIDSILLNGRMGPEAPPEGGVGWDLTVVSGDVDPETNKLGPGGEAKITLTLDTTGYGDVTAFISGVIYDFTLHTAGGGSYPASARAP